MNDTPDSQDEQPLAAARSEVFAWLCASRGDPLRLHRGELSASRKDAEIVARFLSRVQSDGFTMELVNDGSESDPQWSGHWRYRGSHLEGFKQPTLTSSPGDAQLLACAALLKNEWCRSRLS
jgi:hypothetical protein